MSIQLPEPCLIVLVGPSGSGKSTWAAAQVSADQILSSDRFRAMVGEHEHDQRAGKAAFEVLDAVLGHRLKRRLTTVVDSLGLDRDRRRGWVAAAESAGVPCFAITFDTAPELCRQRNRERQRPVPASVLATQLRTWAEVRETLDDDGFDGVHAADDVVFVSPEMLAAAAAGAAGRQQDAPVSLRFGLQIPRFGAPGGPPAMAGWLERVATGAEDAGFDSVWVMDHFLQIPQVGREWEDMVDSYTTLGWLAGVTERVRLGALVTGITYRNVAHLSKIVATLDVLSGGRAICGLGAAWFEREHRAYGWDFPPLRERYALLEDALQLLPLMWGKGSPSFEGKVLQIPEAICYPRPLQDHVPILVGGSGERRTLRLVAQYADACNLFGDADTVRHKVDVLKRHCAEVDRDPDEIEVTHLSTVLVGSDRDEVNDVVARLKPERGSAASFAARVNAGTVEDHIGRFRTLAEAGVQTAIVNVPDLAGGPSIDAMAEVIAAFA